MHDRTAPFVCPVCGAVSHNPNDAAHRYCGRCHRFADEVTMRLDIAPHRLRWGGPKERVTQTCSVIGCGVAFTCDDVPLRMWKDDGSAIALCDVCVDRYVVSDQAGTKRVHGKEAKRGDQG